MAKVTSDLMRNMPEVVRLARDAAMKPATAPAMAPAVQDQPPAAVPQQQPAKVETPPVVVHNPDLRKPEPSAASPVMTPAQEPQSPEPTPQPETPSDPWEQKWKVLAGKMRSELGITPRAHGNLNWEENYGLLQERYNSEVRFSNLSKQLMNTQQVMKFQNEALTTLKDYQGKIAQPKTAVVQQQPAVSVVLNPQDYEHLGEEGIQLVTAVNESLKTINALKSEIGQLRGTTETLSNRSMAIEKNFGETRSNSFWAEVKRLEPDWDTFNGTQDGQNADEMWASYLNQVDAKTGETNRDLAGRAMQRGSVASLVEFAKEFKRQTGWRAPVNLNTSVPFIEPDQAGPRPIVTSPPKRPPVTRDQVNEASRKAALSQRKEDKDAAYQLAQQYREDVNAGRSA